MQCLLTPLRRTTDLLTGRALNPSATALAQTISWKSNQIALGTFDPVGHLQKVILVVELPKSLFRGGADCRVWIRGKLL